MKFKVTDSKGQTFIAQKSNKLPVKDQTPVLDEDKEENIDIEEKEEDKKDEKVELSKEELKELIKELLPDLLKDIKSESEDKEDEDEDKDSDIDEEADEDKEEEENFLELDENEEVVDLDGEDKEDDEEEDIITDDSLDDCGTTSKDSKSSFGSIETNRAKTNDSVSIEQEINLAWAKRYGGK